MAGARYFSARFYEVADVEFGPLFRLKWVCLINPKMPSTTDLAMRRGRGAFETKYSELDASSSKKEGKYDPYFILYNAVVYP